MPILENFLIRQAKEEKKYLQNYLSYSKVIKKITSKELKEFKIFVFGSILKKGTRANDIDLMIISPALADYKKRLKLLVKIKEKLGLFSPFEIHLITPTQYENWYKYFIKRKLSI